MPGIGSCLDGHRRRLDAGFFAEVGQPVPPVGNPSVDLGLVDKRGTVRLARDHHGEGGG